MIITIGSFDGFHKGHAELFDVCRRNSHDNNWAVVSFFPSPSEFMKRRKFSLFTITERELIRKVLGIPNMYILKFDEAMKNLEPSRFWELLREKFCVDGLVMGSDFHFGVNRSGSAEYLEKIARSEGISKIFILDLLNKAEYSSSNAREKISAGDVEGAANILGYPWFMISSVIHGSERGRTMHFPTANINLSGRQIVPAFGVYSSAVLVNGKWHCGALSIGNNPTFHDINETRAEVFVMDFDGSLYGQNLPVFFLKRIRGIKIFPDKTELIKQIEHDIDTCRKFYNEAFSNGDIKIFLENAKKIYYSGENLKPEIINLI